MRDIRRGREQTVEGRTCSPFGKGVGQAGDPLQANEARALSLPVTYNRNTPTQSQPRTGSSHTHGWNALIHTELVDAQGGVAGSASCTQELMADLSFSGEGIFFERGLSSRARTMRWLVARIVLISACAPRARLVGEIGLVVALHCTLFHDLPLRARTLSCSLLTLEEELPTQRAAHTRALMADFLFYR